MFALIRRLCLIGIAAIAGTQAHATSLEDLVKVVAIQQAQISSLLQRLQVAEGTAEEAKKVANEARDTAGQTKDAVSRSADTALATAKDARSAADQAKEQTVAVGRTADSALAAANAALSSADSSVKFKTISNSTEETCKDTCWRVANKLCIASMWGGTMPLEPHSCNERTGGQTCICW